MSYAVAPAILVQSVSPGGSTEGNCIRRFPTCYAPTDAPQAGRPTTPSSSIPPSSPAGSLPQSASKALELSPSPMPRSNHRTHVYVLRLTPGEHATLSARAHTAGAPLSTYLRERALGHRLRSWGNRLGPADLDHLVDLGTQLNAFARAANTARRIIGAPEIGELLAQLRAVAESLRAKLS